MVKIIEKAGDFMENREFGGLFMKKSLFALAAIASLGLFAVGCGDGEEGAACVSTLLDCSEGLVCNTYAGECQTPDACAAKKGYFCIFF